MSTASLPLPLKKTVIPADQAELAAVVKQAAAAGMAVYPIGGGTSQDHGLTAKRDGWGISLAKLNRLIDYPARDMTITAEAGITIAELKRTLAAEGQRLPVDIPQADRATLGGVIASNVSGPRRYGCGTMRDYVIGISAVDGRGVAFKGGGRVVKNVAGYDFCKLLTGSFGTLAVITQVTLKVKPTPEASAFILVDLTAWNQAESLLAGLIDSAATPTAIELVAGPAWAEDPALGKVKPGVVCGVVVGLEGTKVEVEWMLKTFAAEWKAAGLPAAVPISGDPVAGLWGRLTEFPVCPESPLVIKAGVLPSGTVSFVQELFKIDPQCSVQAHAGDGVVVARFSRFSADDVLRTLVGQLQPAAARLGGHVAVLSHGSEGVWTRRAVWGVAGDELGPMQAVKSQFDPHGILNPDRFVYI